MEFGSLGLGLPSQSASNQTGTTGLAQSATLGANPENAVTPVGAGDGAGGDRRQDTLGQDQSGARNSPAPDDLQLTSRRTTLNFDSEQNRIFLEVVDSNTEEVIERIPSDQLVELVQQVLGSGVDRAASTDDDAAVVVPAGG